MKHWKLSAALVLIASLLATSIATAANPITLIVNGQRAAVEPLLVDGSTYVPLRAAGEMLDASVAWDGPTRTVTITSGGAPTYDAVLTFPANQYPETAAHIQAAIANGHSAVCTIDRAGADDNRSASLAGIPTKDGHDRDEWPMAMCAEGGAGASVAYVDSSDNRGAGSWVGNQLDQYQDGTRVLFVMGSSAAIEWPETAAESSSDDVTYASCAAVREAGAAPLHRGDPGYSTRLDRDGDGIACE